MRLSLSGRIIELEYRSCELSVPDFLQLARACGYDAVELRTTQLPIETTSSDAEQIRKTAEGLGLEISCCIPPGITADESGLHRLEQFARLARILECDTVKVWVESADWLQQACDRLLPSGVSLVAQTHTNGPFETIDSCLEIVSRVNRGNFGLQYDPANLFEAGQEYGEEAVQRLGPHILQLSVQCVRLAAPDEADIWEHVGRRFRRCLLEDPGALDYRSVFRGLRAIRFEGAITVNEPKPAVMNTGAFALRMNDDLSRLCQNVALT